MPDSRHQDGSATRNGYIKVTCSATEGSFTTIGDSNQASFYEVDVEAPCSGAAAPAGSKKKEEEKGGSGGVVFIIILLVAPTVYFAGGFIFNWKVKNLEGRERIPHVDFWAGLPGLIKEGARFSKSKVTRSDCEDMPPNTPPPCGLNRVSPWATTTTTTTTTTAKQTPRSPAAMRLFAGRPMANAGARAA